MAANRSLFSSSAPKLRLASRVSRIALTRQKDVVEPGVEAELSDPVDRAGSRTETTAGEGPSHVVATNEADLRNEIVPDQQMVGGQAVSIARIGELPLIARILAGPPGRPGPGEIAQKVDVVEEREGPVDAVRLVRAVVDQRDRSVGDDPADAAPPKDVALDAEDREICRDRTRHVVLVRLDVERADVERAHLPGHPPTGDD